MPKLRLCRRDDLQGATRDELLEIAKDVAYAINNNFHQLILEENKIMKMFDEDLVNYIVNSRSFMVEE